MEEVPIEVIPLVKAVNDALGRLDKGYERHKRFLADAAHELRTPDRNPDNAGLVASNWTGKHVCSKTPPV